MQGQVQIISRKLHGSIWPVHIKPCPVAVICLLLKLLEFRGEVRIGLVNGFCTLGVALRYPLNCFCNLSAIQANPK